MNTSTRFTVGIHILTLLAYNENEPLTSDYIAGSVNTNSVVVRRLLSQLRAARLVSSHRGPGGGTQLGRPARGITLRDVYIATQAAELFPMHPREPNPLCPVGSAIQATLAGHFDSSRLALEKQLEKTTIADLVEELQSRSRR